MEDFRDTIVGLDCEMVGVNNGWPKVSVLARACVVSGHGEVLIGKLSFIDISALF